MRFVFSFGWGGDVIVRCSHGYPPSITQQSENISYHCVIPDNIQLIKNHFKIWIGHMWLYNNLRDQYVCNTITLAMDMRHDAEYLQTKRVVNCLFSLTAQSIRQLLKNIPDLFKTIKYTMNQ